MSQTVFAVIHEADGRFGISFPDFPGCVAAGASMDEAIERGRATLAFHIGAIDESGYGAAIRMRRIGELHQDPQFRRDAEGAFIVAMPIDLPGKAVRVNVSLEHRLLEQIDRAADASGQSRSGFLADAAKQRIKSTLEAEGPQPVSSPARSISRLVGGAQRGGT